jgi:hypothetical protein
MNANIARVGTLVGLIVLVFALVFGVQACSYTSPDASNFACVYHGGWFDSKKFEKAVAPGSGRTKINVAGSSFDVPVNVRQYDNSDGLPDVSVTVRGVPLTFKPSLTFTISSVMDDEGKPAGCTLIEQHLRPLDATDFNRDESRWASQFLNVRVGPVVRDVAPRVLQGLDPTKLALNVDGERDRAAVAFGEALTTTLAQQLGGRYFCAPTFRYGGTAEQCGTISVVLPEPTMSDEDRNLIARPQRARTEADNEIAVATESARKAEQVAAQLGIEAESAEAAADAREQIAEQEGRVAQADASNTYAWCAYLETLNQDCALVRAAEGGDFPDVYTPGGEAPVVAVTPPSTP